MTSSAMRRPRIQISISSASRTGGEARGSLLWLYLDYEAGREVVTVRVINANTGDVTTYEARRADIGGRRFTTLDGRPITLADVDRMELRTER